MVNYEKKKNFILLENKMDGPVFKSVYCLFGK